MQEPLETAELLAFAKTVEARSQTKAAVLLGVPRATLNRRLARLEERLGARLLRRTTRQLSLTDAGEALYRHARIVLDAVGHAEASVRQTSAVVRGDLRVAVPPFPGPGFSAIVGEFVKRCPQVRLHIFSSTQLVDLQSGACDVAIRATDELAPGLVARTLLRGRTWAVASPAYLAENGVPRSTKDLRRHRCLMGYARGEVPQTHWPLRGGGRLQLEGVFFSNDIFLLRDATVRGLGISLLPDMLVRPALDAGSITPVLADKIGSDVKLSIVYAERELMPLALRAFVDALVDWQPGDEVARLAAACDEAAGAVRGKPRVP